jgi:sarcosine oxidase
VRRDYQYIVVGLGGIGSAAAYRLARRVGPDVLGLEQFEVGHDRGASQDHSRIIRLSYHSSAYVRLAVAAYDAWSVLERDSGSKLIVKTGGLDLWPPGAAIPMDDYTTAMAACGVPFELMDGPDVMKRWPQFRLDDATVGVYQADGGIAPAAQCNSEHIRMARAYGATLLENQRVTSVRETGSEIEVTCGRDVYRGSKLIVAADAWTNEILATWDLRLPLTVTQEQVTYFTVPRPRDFSPGRFPIWIWMDEPSFYGLPIYGEAGPKAAQDVGGKEVSPETRTFEADHVALERVVRFIESHIPGGLGPIIYTKTCLYTMPPDRDFVVDTVPGANNVLVALGAAHGFKFAALFGQILEELAIDGNTSADISLFKIDRPILKRRDPPRSFLV